MDNRYRPIACDLHDQYLAWSTLKRRVLVEHIAEDGSQLADEGLITDVFTQGDDRSEWMMLSTGRRIRLDRIDRVSAV